LTKHACIKLAASLKNIVSKQFTGCNNLNNSNNSNQFEMAGQIDHILYVDRSAISRVLVEKTRMLGTFWVQDVTTGQKVPPNVINNTPCIICLRTKQVFMPREVVAYVERLLRNQHTGSGQPGQYHQPGQPGQPGQPSQPSRPIHVYREVDNQYTRIEKLDDPLRGDNQPGAYSFASAYQKRYRIDAQGEAGRSMSGQIIDQLLRAERESGPIRSMTDTATAREEAEMMARRAAEEKRLEEKSKSVH